MIPLWESAASASDVDLRFGDCLAVLRDLPDSSVDVVITDPPYGLAEHKPERIAAALVAWTSGDRDHVPDGKGFMGRSWDAFVPPPAVWDECLRVLKPGGHLAAFAGSRTYDLMGMSIRLAGFEIRDGLQWIMGSGFPKGLDVSKAIDATLLHGGANSRRIRQANETRPGEGRIAPQITNNGHMGEKVPGSVTRDQPSTPAAEQWQGWGTALKPAVEPIVLARKPLSGTVAANVLAHGTGAINVDACRVAVSVDDDIHAKNPHTRGGFGHAGAAIYTSDGRTVTDAYDARKGRWPANVVLTHDPACRPPECADACPVAELDRQSGNLPTQKTRSTPDKKYGEDHIFAFGNTRHGPTYFGEQGGASRFFPVFRYQAKAPASERPKIDGKGWPTVKPQGLMRWLVRLLTPPGGTVLDPFAGTGSTLQAARDEGFHAVGVERDEFAYRLACQRLGLPAPEEAA